MRLNQQFAASFPLARGLPIVVSDERPFRHSAGSALIGSPNRATEKGLIFNNIKNHRHNRQHRQNDADRISGIGTPLKGVPILPMAARKAAETLSNQTLDLTFRNSCKSSPKNNEVVKWR